VRKHFGDLIKNVSLEEGVAKMAAWAKKAGARQGKLFEGIEIRKNLPPSWAAFSKS
jgi:UDP-glucose 4-epimerase